jgi:hypothetical protein
VPEGADVMPIMFNYRIKDDETFKARAFVLGNLENFQGDRYAPTISKAVMWLMFALSTLLILNTRLFDISGAFLSERPKRDIYVTWKGKVGLLMWNLYGVGDAPKLFNEGLVNHLKKGNYRQSIYEPCLFYKFNSPTEFIYIVFHVDDFNVAGTDQIIISEFHEHLKTKYGVTSNEKGIFLGIMRTELEDGRTLFTKPFIMKKTIGNLST